jgi:hypothetical protein
MVINDGIAEWFQLPMTTVLAFDAGLFAHAGPPFLGTGRRVAGFSGLVFPTNGVDVVTAPEQAAEQGDFLFRGQVLVAAKKRAYSAALVGGE